MNVIVTAIPVSLGKTSGEFGCSLFKIARDQEVSSPVLPTEFVTCLPTKRMYQDCDGLRTCFSH